MRLGTHSHSAQGQRWPPCTVGDRFRFMSWDALKNVAWNTLAQESLSLHTYPFPVDCDYHGTLNQPVHLQNSEVKERRWMSLLQSDTCKYPRLVSQLAQHKKPVQYGQSVSREGEIHCRISVAGRSPKMEKSTAGISVPPPKNKGSKNECLQNTYCTVISKSECL